MGEEARKSFLFTAGLIAELPEPDPEPEPVYQPNEPPRLPGPDHARAPGSDRRRSLGAGDPAPAAESHPAGAADLELSFYEVLYVLKIGSFLPGTVLLDLRNQSKHTVRRKEGQLQLEPPVKRLVRHARSRKRADRKKRLKARVDNG
jgi:hypothetical protein